MKEDIGKLWAQEVREKKRTASGVHSKTGKRGYVGKMLFATDFMSSKERREYTKPSEVRSLTLSELVYESIVPYKEFLNFDEKKQKELMEKWREHHKNNDIIEKMGIRKNDFYELINKLNVEKKDKARIPIPPHEREELSFDKLQEALNSKELIPYGEFKKIPRYQQVQIFFNYDKRFNRTPEFAKAWGTTNSILYNLRSEIKKYDEKQKKKEAENQLEKEVVKEEIPVQEIKEEEEVVQSKKEDTHGTTVDIPALQESLFEFFNKGNKQVSREDIEEAIKKQALEELSKESDSVTEEQESLELESDNNPIIEEAIDKEEEKNEKDDKILSLEQKLDQIQKENEELQAQLKALMEEKSEKPNKPEHLQDVNVSGFKFNLTGEFSSNMLVNKLTKIIPFVAGGDRYYLDLNIIEKETSE